MKKENNSVDIAKKTEEMLNYITNKYNYEFEFCEFVPAETGFNDGLNENILIVKEKSSNRLINVRETLSKPGKYYDDFVSTYASFLYSKCVDFDDINSSKSTNVYVTLKDEYYDLIINQDIDSITNEALNGVTLVVNIPENYNEEILRELYDSYQLLQQLEIFKKVMIVGFTNGGETYDPYVDNYRLHGHKTWRDMGNEVFAEMIIKDDGLSYTEFIDKLSEF